MDNSSQALADDDGNNEDSSLSSVWWPARLIGAGGKLRLASTSLKVWWLIYVILLLWKNVYEVVMYDLDPDSRAFHSWKSKEADISQVLYLLNAVSNLSAAYSVVMLPQSVLLPPCGRYQRWITIWFFVVTIVLGFVVGYLRDVGVIDTGQKNGYYCASECPTAERCLYAWLCHKNATSVAAFMEVSKDVLANMLPTTVLLGVLAKEALNRVEQAQALLEEEHRGANAQSGSQFENVSLLGVENLRSALRQSSKCVGIWSVMLCIAVNGLWMVYDVIKEKDNASEESATLRIYHCIQILNWGLQILAPIAAVTYCNTISKQVVQHFGHIVAVPLRHAVDRQDMHMEAMTTKINILGYIQNLVIEGLSFKVCGVAFTKSQFMSLCAGFVGTLIKHALY